VTTRTQVDLGVLALIVLSLSGLVVLRWLVIHSVPFWEPLALGVVIGVLAKRGPC